MLAASTAKSDEKTAEFSPELISVVCRTLPSALSRARVPRLAPTRDHENADAIDQERCSQKHKKDNLAQAEGKGNHGSRQHPHKGFAEQPIGPVGHTSGRRQSWP